MRRLLSASPKWVQKKPFACLLPSHQGFSQGSGHTNLDNAINDRIVFRTTSSYIFMIDMVDESLPPLRTHRVRQGGESRGARPAKEPQKPPIPPGWVKIKYLKI